MPVEYRRCEETHMRTRLPRYQRKEMVEGLTGDNPTTAVLILLITDHLAYRALRAVKANTSSGPDPIPLKICSTFAFKLAPVVRDLYNASLVHGSLPPQLKQSVVSPITKVPQPAMEVVVHKTQQDLDRYSSREPGMRCLLYEARTLQRINSQRATATATARTLF